MDRALEQGAALTVRAGCGELDEDEAETRRGGAGQCEGAAGPRTDFARARCILRWPTRREYFGEPAAAEWRRWFRTIFPDSDRQLLPHGDRTDAHFWRGPHACYGYPRLSLRLRHRP